MKHILPDANIGGEDKGNHQRTK